MINWGGRRKPNSSSRGEPRLRPTPYSQKFPHGGWGFSGRFDSPVNEIELIREFRFVDSIETQERLYYEREIPPVTREAARRQPKEPG